jgi:hypothetical protein
MYDCRESFRKESREKPTVSVKPVCYFQELAACITAHSQGAAHRQGHSRLGWLG